MKRRFYLIALVVIIAVESLAGTTIADSPNKLKLMVLSELEEDSLDAFYKEIALSNPMFDPVARPEEIEDADFVVFLLEDWSDLELYLEGELPPILEKIQNAPTNQIKAYVKSHKRDGSPVHFIFYSRGGSKGKSLACYAEDIATTPNGEASVMTSESCL